MVSSTVALDRPATSAALQQPDRSPRAIAERRELDRMAAASNALKGIHRTPDSMYIHEMWILGEIADEKCHEMIRQYLRAKYGR